MFEDIIKFMKTKGVIKELSCKIIYSIENPHSKMKEEISEMAQEIIEEITLLKKEEINKKSKMLDDLLYKYLCLAKEEKLIEYLKIELAKMLG